MGRPRKTQPAPEGAAQEVETPQPAPEGAAQVSDGLIPVSKGGEVIRIHPANLADHQRLGWKVQE